MKEGRVFYMPDKDDLDAFRVHLADLVALDNNPKLAALLDELDKLKGYPVSEADLYYSGGCFF